MRVVVLTEPKGRLGSGEDRCKLCGRVSLDPGQELIYACGCNNRTHRDCIKKYIIQRQLSKCPHCSNDFLIGYTLGMRLACDRPRIVQKCVFTAALIVCATVVVVLAIVFTGTLEQTRSRAEMLPWRVVILALLGICGAGLLAYIVVVVYEYCLKKEIVDISVYCSRSEIAQGMEDPQKHLKKFFVWLHEEGYYERMAQERIYPELRPLLPRKAKKLPKKEPQLSKEEPADSEALVLPVHAAEEQKAKEATVSKVQIAVPEGWAEHPSADPNEAVIYSYHQDREAPPAAALPNEPVVPLDSPQEGSAPPPPVQNSGSHKVEELNLDTREKLREEEKVPLPPSDDNEFGSVSVRKLVEEMRDKPVETVLSGMEDMRSEELHHHTTSGHVMGPKSTIAAKK